MYSVGTLIKAVNSQTNDHFEYLPCLMHVTILKYKLLIDN